MTTKPILADARFVRLAATGNPDFQQYYGEGVMAPTQEVRVKHVDEAIEACRAYINEHDLGSGNWTGGQITDAAGNVIAKISYNLRVWPPGPWTTDLKPIYEPKIGPRGETR